MSILDVGYSSQLKPVLLEGLLDAERKGIASFYLCSVLQDLDVVPIYSVFDLDALFSFELRGQRRANSLIVSNQWHRLLLEFTYKASGMRSIVHVTDITTRYNLTFANPITGIKTTMSPQGCFLFTFFVCTKNSSWRPRKFAFIINKDFVLETVDTHTLPKHMQQGVSSVNNKSTVVSYSLAKLPVFANLVDGCFARKNSSSESTNFYDMRFGENEAQFTLNFLNALTLPEVESWTPLFGSCGSSFDNYRWLVRRGSFLFGGVDVVDRNI